MSMRSIDFGMSLNELRHVTAEGMLEVLKLNDEAVAEMTRQMRATIEEWQWEIESIQFWRRHARSPFAPTSRHIAAWFFVFLCTLSFSVWTWFSVPRVWPVTISSVLTPLFYSFICLVRYIRIDYW